jgi:hypothetical protein
MGKLLIFIGGLLVGILTTILVMYKISEANEPSGNEVIAEANNPFEGLLGLTKFSEKGECITKGEMEIFQVFEPNIALAQTGKYPDEIMVLLINNNNEAYYDGLKIKMPTNKCARQIGIYQYATRMGIEKTVPAVVIE